MHCYPLSSSRKIPATHTGVYMYIYIYVWFQKNFGNDNMYQLCTKCTCTVMGFFYRKSRSTRTDKLYIYINPTRVIEISIDTSHVFNTHALLSALFRQTESCHPYWQNVYIYIYVWLQKNYGNANMYQSSTKYICTVMRSFQVERFLPPILAYYIYIYLVPTRITEIPIDTSHVLNTHTLFSALFRQKESCHPYWYIISKDMWFQKNCIWKFIFYVLGIY